MLPLPSLSPEMLGLSPERLARIGVVLNELIRDGAIPGAVVAVARYGKLAYLESFGYQDRLRERPMRADALFRIYSMTKPCVSVGAMTLVEEGRIQLNDPVSKYLPSFKKLRVFVPRADPISGSLSSLTPVEREPTIHDLLRHTAGLAYDFVTCNAHVKEALGRAGLLAVDPRFRDALSGDWIERLANVPLVSQPGTAWEYSLATDVLGRVLEVACGARLSQILEQRLFKPLHMLDSGFTIPAEALGRLAEPLPGISVFDMSAAPQGDSGGSGGVSSAADYLRFAQMLLNGGVLDGVRILSRTSVALMLSDHLGADIKATVTPGELLMGVRGYTFGLGLMIRQSAGLASVPGSVGELGWGGVFGTFFWADPKEDLAAVYMTQASPDNRQYYRRLIKQLVHQAIVD